MQNRFAVNNSFRQVTGVIRKLSSQFPFFEKARNFKFD